METWNKTSRKLKECADSMSPFATERLIELVRSKNPDLSKELEDLSPDAKMRKIASLFKPKRV
jgi:hypothetical protein